MPPMLERWDALNVSTINKANALTGGVLSVVAIPSRSSGSIGWRGGSALAQDAKGGRMGDHGGGYSLGFTPVADSTRRQRPMPRRVSKNYPTFGNNDYAPYIQKVQDSGAEGMCVALARR